MTPLSSSLDFHFAIIFKGFPIEDLKLKTKDKLSKVQIMELQIALPNLVPT
jgi:hypothetical protein